MPDPADRLAGRPSRQIVPTPETSQDNGCDRDGEAPECTRLPFFE